MRCDACGTHYGKGRACPKRARHRVEVARCRCRRPEPGVLATKRRTTLDGCHACGGRRS